MSRFNLKKVWAGSARRGDVVHYRGQAWIARKDTGTQPPHDDWLPATVNDPLWAIEQGQPGPPGESVRGDKGERGEPGADGAGLAFRGDWKRSTRYSTNDVVTLEGSSFIATSESRGIRPRPNSRAWAVLAAKGERGRRGEAGEQGSPGQRGRSVRFSESSGTTDLELLFDDTAKAGQVVRSSGDGCCKVANGLSYYTCWKILGLAVSDTLAGSTGKVRTVGLLTLPDWSLVTSEQSLHASRSLCLKGYGGLSSTDADNTAILHTLGRSITSDTLLIMPGQVTSINFQYHPL